MSNSVPSAGIRAELARAGVEQKVVAEWLGYQPSQITRRMQGEVEWRISEIQIIAKRLGLPITALMDEPEAAPTTPADGSAVRS
jgi:hypothetical protein